VVDLNLSLGSRAPIHCTAVGKALLAHLPEPEQNTLIAQMKLSKHAPSTITSKKALRDTLAAIRDQVLAVDDEESAPPLCQCRVRRS
jgi:DNA-binding IclR family transcriptional regulator